MRNTVGNSSAAKLDALDLAQLVLSLLLSYPVDGVAALGVVNETEVLASLLDGDHIHEAGGVGGVGADFAVNLDEALHEDGLGLAGVEGIFEAIAEEDDQGHAVTELVRTRGSLGSIGTWEKVNCLPPLLISAEISVNIPDSLSRSQCEGALRRF